MEGNYFQTEPIDIIEKLKPFFKQGSLFIRDDGKIDRNMRHDYDSPWIFARTAPNRDCFLYMNLFSPTWKMVHSRCQECWKVVVKPRTLEQLFNLLKLQQELNLPSKCGIELREYISALYGGYFYNNSLEEGQECYDLIKSRFKGDLLEENSTILKRGCTEMERDFGDSSKWSTTDYQLQLESVLQEAFVQDIKRSPTPDYLIRYIQRKWIRWAYSNGDITYKLYTEGKSLLEPYSMYHKEVKNG